MMTSQSDGQLDRYDVAAMISECHGQDHPGPTSRPPDVPAPLRAMFEHYDTSGLISKDVTLRAVLERPPRTLRRYFEEPAAEGQAPQS